MTMQNLYFFMEIVKDMNLGVTAKRLFTTQQSLSGHIKRMEAYFGVRLFRRNPFLVLTKEGEELVREAKNILEAEERLFLSFGTGPKREFGTLRIACGLARSRFYLPEILSEFTSRHPSVGVTFVDENTFREQGQLMFSGNNVDIAICRPPRPSPGLTTIPLLKIGGCVVISDSLLREHIKNADEFIENARNGLELSKLPASIPVAHTGIAKHERESWICEVIPELRNRPRIYIDPENHDVLLKVCQEGKAMLLISELYVKYILNTFSPSFTEKLHIFPHNLNGQRFTIEEALSYDSKRLHPQYFSDFINITLSVFDKMKNESICGKSAGGQ